MQLFWLKLLPSTSKVTEFFSDTTGIKCFTVLCVENHNIKVFLKSSVSVQWKKSILIAMWLIPLGWNEEENQCHTIRFYCLNIISKSLIGTVLKDFFFLRFLLKVTKLAITKQTQKNHKRTKGFQLIQFMWYHDTLYLQARFKILTLNHKFLDYFLFAIQIIINHAKITISFEWMLSEQILLHTVYLHM